MITNFKQFNENLLVPRNLEGRKEKLKQIHIKLLSQEVVDGDLNIDESFIDINPKLIKVKKVNGTVRLMGLEWKEIPAWLKGVEIRDDFNCLHNKLESLEGCPETIERNFYCSYNLLKSLKGCPENIGGNFYCDNNKLTSLQGCPKIIGGGFWCTNNKVKLELPAYVKLKGRFYN